MLCFSYKDDRLITSVNPRVNIIKENADKGFYEMVINDVLPEDAGCYKCIASNEHGEVECEANVTVTSEFHFIIDSFIAH